MDDKKQVYAVVLPAVLIVSTYLAFELFVRIFGLKAGYFLGFMFYWGFWCLLVPYTLLGKRSFRELFRRAEGTAGRNWQYVALSVIPPLMAFMFGPFWDRVHSPWYVIVLSIPYAIVNATAEEILWRGLYIKLFPKSLFLGFLYPSVGFALSHISPLAVNPSSMGVVPFVMSALFIGLCWGWVALKTQSLRWVIVSHILLDASGIGVLFYFS